MRNTFFVLQFFVRLKHAPILMKSASNIRVSEFLRRSFKFYIPFFSYRTMTVLKLLFCFRRRKRQSSCSIRPNTVDSASGILSWLCNATPGMGRTGPTDSPRVRTTRDRTRASTTNEASWKRWLRIKDVPNSACVNRWRLWRRSITRWDNYVYCRYRYSCLKGEVCALDKLGSKDPFISKVGPFEATKLEYECRYFLF